MALFSFAVGVLSWATHFWFAKVATIVPEPHLDEVFHIPQAQAYCQGKWNVWDSKLTTPPGLYLISYFFSHTYFLDCTVSFLRSQNAIVNCLLLPYVVQNISIHLHQGQHVLSSQKDIVERFETWTAINVSLFPILFFFSALYYTDVGATFWVLVAYLLFLERRTATSCFYLPNSHIIRDSALIASGLVALSFRQTNIFWVGIFLGGLEALRTLKKANSSGGSHPDSSYDGIIARSWSDGQIYDPPIDDAWIQDYFKTTLSLAISAIARLPIVMPALAPYLVLVVSFIAFVVWNGGVVLGDKSNHVASLHLAQLLYLFPFFTFFSLPLLYRHLVAFLVPQHLLPPTLRVLPPTSPNALLRPRLTPFLAFLALSLLIIRFSTTVHPFTLADNRHYTFYIFRRILLRTPLHKYLLAPNYVLTGWAVIRALGGSVAAKPPSPSRIAPAPKDPTPNAPKATHSPATPQGGNSARVSFALVWLATVALALGTVPLVEPRYLILPWVLWRVHLPLPQQQNRAGTRVVSRTRALRAHVGETAWFGLINAVTGYIFLYRGFDWASEKGKVQRFMW